MMDKITFSDLEIGMCVKTYLSDHIIRKITNICKESFSVTLSHSFNNGECTETYQTTLHWRNLYQVYINEKWVDVRF